MSEINSKCANSVLKCENEVDSDIIAQVDKMRTSGI